MMRPIAKSCICAVALVVVAACQKGTEPAGSLLPAVQPLTVVIGPAAGDIGACGSLQLSATARDFSGTAVTQDSVRWSSSADPTQMMISSGGMLRSLTPAGFAYDTVRATVWSGVQTGTAKTVWSAENDLVVVIGPDGKPLPPAPCKTGS